MAPQNKCVSPPLAAAAAIRDADELVSRDKTDVRTGASFSNVGIA